MATLRPAFCSCSPAKSSNQALVSINRSSRLYGSVSHLGFGSISTWSGLKRLQITLQTSYFTKDMVKKCRGKAIYASLFGVGAPEALVIGVVALLVFGPKGLAEVARNLGKTLRAFQPTIRELQEVSREFKSTLEKEIGLDEVASQTNGAYSSLTNKVPKPRLDPSNPNNQNTAIDATNPINENAGLDPANPNNDNTAADSSDSSIIDVPSESPATTQAYTSEELLQRTEDQLAAAATTNHTSQKSSDQKEQPLAPADPAESVAGSEDATVAIPSETTAEDQESQPVGERS